MQHRGDGIEANCFHKYMARRSVIKEWRVVPKNFVYRPGYRTGSGRRASSGSSSYSALSLTFGHF